MSDLVRLNFPDLFSSQANVTFLRQPELVSVSKGSVTFQCYLDNPNYSCHPDRPRICEGKLVFLDTKRNYCICQQQQSCWIANNSPLNQVIVTPPQSYLWFFNLQFLCMKTCYKAVTQEENPSSIIGPMLQLYLVFAL